MNWPHRKLGQYCSDSLPNLAKPITRRCETVSSFRCLSLGWLNNNNKKKTLKIKLQALYHKTDLQTLYFSGTYCHKTGTRPPSCTTPWQMCIRGSFLGSSHVYYLYCNPQLKNILQKLIQALKLHKKGKYLINWVGC